MMILAVAICTILLVVASFVLIIAYAIKHYNPNDYPSSKSEEFGCKFCTLHGENTQWDDHP